MCQCDYGIDEFTGIIRRNYIQAVEYHDAGRKHVSLELLRPHLVQEDFNHTGINAGEIAGDVLDSRFNDVNCSVCLIDSVHSLFAPDVNLGFSLVPGVFGIESDKPTRILVAKRGKIGDECIGFRLGRDIKRKNVLTFGQVVADFRTQCGFPGTGRTRHQHR